MIACENFHKPRDKKSKTGLQICYIVVLAIAVAIEDAIVDEY